MVDQVLHDGDEAGIGVGRALILQHRQCNAGIEIGDGQIGATRVDRGGQRQDAGYVEDRQRRPDPIARATVISPCEAASVSDHAAMGQQAALGI